MDEKDKKIKELEKQLKTEQDARAADTAAHEKAIQEKDVLIEQKNKDIIGARHEYKKLSEMSAEEKAAMSEKEVELQKRQEEFEERQLAFEKSQKEQLQKEVDARKAAAIAKLAGNDADLKKKIEDNYGRIKEAGDAQTEEEIVRIASEAFNMLGVPRPDGIRQAINGEGAAPDNGGSGTNFAETADGKALSQKLGLPTETPKPPEVTPPVPAA